MKTLIVIPTRNRPKEQLERTISKVDHTTRNEEHEYKIFVVDNNDRPTVSHMYHGDWVIVVDNAWGKKKSDAEAQAIGLRYAEAHGYDVVVKWDDDLEPGFVCIKSLVNTIRIYGIPAAGGLYPSAGDQRRAEMVNGEIVTPDRFGPRHAQFFFWGESMPQHMDVQHLYSSFAYDVKKATACGGWCTDYSSLCYRHETDFTLRMSNMFGPLQIWRHAIATHMRAGTVGGTKSFTQEEQNWMRQQDTVLFRNRMIEHGIDYHF